MLYVSISLTQCPWHDWQSRAQHQDGDTVSNDLFQNDKQHLNYKCDYGRKIKDKQWSRWKGVPGSYILQTEATAIYNNILLVSLTPVMLLYTVLCMMKMIQEES